MEEAEEDEEKESSYRLRCEEAVKGSERETANRESQYCPALKKRWRDTGRGQLGVFGGTEERRAKGIRIRLGKGAGRGYTV